MFSEGTESDQWHNMVYEQYLRSEPILLKTNIVKQITGIEMTRSP